MTDNSICEELLSKINITKSNITKDVLCFLERYADHFVIVMFYFILFVNIASCNGLPSALAQSAANHTRKHRGETPRLLTISVTGFSYVHNTKISVTWFSYVHNTTISVTGFSYVHNTTISITGFSYVHNTTISVTWFSFTCRTQHTGPTATRPIVSRTKQYWI